MIRHVVVISWQPGVTADQRRQAQAELEALPPLMTGLRAYSVGPDAGLATGNADFAIVADFDDVDAYLAYRNHPAHVDVVRRVLNPIVERRSSVQVEL